MRFGLFCSPKADSGDLGPETGQGFRDYLDYNVEAEALGFHSSFLGRASFHRLEPGLRHADAADRARHAHHDAAARHRGDRAALAQSGAAGRAGGDARSDVRRAARFRHRQGLPPQRIRRLPHSDGGGRGALRGSRSRSSPRPGRRAQRFSHHGQFWHFDDIVVEPPPAQKPHPPFWVAAGSEASIRRAARARLQSDPRPVRIARDARRAHRDLPAEREAHGLRFDPMQVAVARQLYVAKDKAEAGSRAGARGRLHPAHGRRLAHAGRQGRTPGSHVLPTPTRRAPPRSTRCTARRTRSAACSRLCSKPASTMCC